MKWSGKIAKAKVEGGEMGNLRDEVQRAIDFSPSLLWLPASFASLRLSARIFCSHLFVLTFSITSIPLIPVIA
jgi:hypothetical protein